MLRVLHVIASVAPEMGGPVEGILSQQEGWVGHREIVSLDPPDAPYVLDFPLRVHGLGQGRPEFLRRGAPLWKRYGYTPGLVRWLRQNAPRFDAVVVNGLWNYTTMVCRIALRGRRVPYFVFTHGMLDPWFARKSPIKHLGKLASWVAVERPLLTGARAVLFTTDEERDLAIKAFPLSNYRTRVVGYGTKAPPSASDVQRRAFRDVVPALGERPYILFLSRIHPKKGCDLLLSAFAENVRNRSDVDLVIAGPDVSGWGDALRHQAQALGISSRVHWPGMLLGDAKWGAMYGCRGFVLPSHQENFGVVVAEAMACGRPVLITDKVNIWREVERAGGLVCRDDARALSAALAHLLSFDPSEASVRGRALQELFASQFSAAGASRALMDVIVESTK